MYKNKEASTHVFFSHLTVCVVLAIPPPIAKLVGFFCDLSAYEVTFLDAAEIETSLSLSSIGSAELDFTSRRM